MRQILLFAALSLALAPAASVHAAQARTKPPARCKNADGKTIECPKTNANGEVTVETPFSRPGPDRGDLSRSPDATIPPMARALCKDGTYSPAAQPVGACELHGGVSQWVR
jgi:hypothetical protein